MYMLAVTETKGFHLDPRTKLLLMAIVVTAEFLYGHTAFMLAVALMPFILLLTNRQYKAAAIFIVLLVAALMAKEIQNSIRFHMAVNVVVVLLVGLVSRLFPAFAMGNYIIKPITASECITSPSRVHIGRNITVPLSALFRFLPTMQEESAAVRDAMRMREVQFSAKKFWQNPMVLLEYCSIPLMVSVVGIGSELSAAALTHGLDSPADRSNITRVGFTCYDATAVVISGVMLFVTLFIIKWQEGE